MKLALIGAAAVAASAFATPALAQAVLQDAGSCPQFYLSEKLFESRPGQSAHRWQLLSRSAERERRDVASGRRVQRVPLSRRTELQRLIAISLVQIPTPGLSGV